MKKLIAAFAILLLTAGSASAQTGFSENVYYNVHGRVKPYCNTPYQGTTTTAYGVYPAMYQDCFTAVWHKAKGGVEVYVWTADGWQHKWQEGEYFWFTWVAEQNKL